MTAGQVEFASDRIELQRMVQCVGSAVRLEARLPKWPFRLPKGFSRVIEYHRVLGGGFGLTLAALARAYGDQSVAAVVLDPGVSYYTEEYGIFPAFQVGAASVARAYAEGMRRAPGGDPAGAFVDSADVVAIAGSSGRWAVWGQRDWEIGLLCTPHDSGPWEDSPVPLFGRAADLTDLRAPDGWGLPLSDDDVTEFWRNVRLWGSGE